MKIALVIERMDVRRGGRETSTAQIASALAAAGQDVTVLCQDGRIDDPAVKVRAMGRRGWLRTSRLRNFVEDVQATMRTGAFDVVHCMLPVPGADVYQLRGGTVPAQAQASLRRRSPAARPMVRLTQRLNAHRRLMGDLEAQTLASPRTRVLAVSEMVAREVRQFYGRTENVCVVYNAVDVPSVSDDDRAHWRQQLRFRLDMRSGDLLLLVVARNFALKGVAETIEAFARWDRVRKGLARLVVVGRDPAAAEGYVRHASLRGVGSHVTFVPDEPDIFRWYSAADACVLLSWYDPCSRVVLEATRWALPSITTEFNGAAEVLARGAGLVVPSPAARDKIVQAFATLADPARRAEMSRRCQAVAPMLTLQRHVEELMNVYRESR